MTEAEAILYIRNQLNDTNGIVFSDEVIGNYIKVATQEITSYISSQGNNRYERTKEVTDNAEIDYTELLFITRVSNKENGTPLYESRDYAFNNNCFYIIDNHIRLSSNIRTAIINYLTFLSDFEADALLQSFILKYALIEGMEKINLDFTAEAMQLQAIKQEAYASVKGVMQLKPNIFNVRR